MSICGKNDALDALKAKQGELDGLLSGGKDLLGDMEAKLNAMKADLTGFLPELPQVDSLQSMLNDLLNLRNPLEIAALQADIKAKFGASLPDLDGLIGDLLKGGDLCSLVPNVEAGADGAVVEQPAEPKVPDEPPAAEVATEKSPKDVADLNKKALKKAWNSTCGTILTRGIAKFDSLFGKKNGIRCIKLSRPTFTEYAAKLIGSSFDDLKVYDYTKEEYSAMVNQLENDLPGATALCVDAFLPMLKEDYASVIGQSQFADAGPFDDAAKEWAERKLAKAAN